MTTASEITFAGIAHDLGVDVPALKSVVDVEAGGNGCLPDGRPKILFERHIFSRRTKGQFDKSNPDISNPSAGGYSGGADEYPRLYRAVALDPAAAIESASWGIAQLMGFNWTLCGAGSLTAFLLQMHAGPDAQLHLFGNFLRSTGLCGALARHDWAAFARGYNGPGYARNDYDKHLAAAYRAHGGA